MSQFKTKVLSRRDLERTVHFTVAVSDGKVKLMDVYIKKESKLLDKLEVGNFYYFGPVFCTQYNSLKVSEETKCWNTSEFDTTTVEQEFFNANVLTTLEAKHSPKKRRLSLTGVLEEVTFKEGDSWTRQELVVRDHTGSATVKLWNHPRVAASSLHAPVTVKNLEIVEYRNNPEIQSTGQTTVDFEEVEETRKILVVLGLDYETEQLIGSEEDQPPSEYKIHSAVCEILQRSDNIPTLLTVMVKGSEITSLLDTEY